MKNKTIKELPGITFSAKLIAYDYHFTDDTDKRNIYLLTLRRGRSVLNVRFGQSLYATAKVSAPTAYDLLSCLTKYDPGTHADFCADFGYDTDSIKALKTYKAVVKEWKKVSAFFTDGELIIIRGIN